LSISSQNFWLSTSTTRVLTLFSFNTFSIKNFVTSGFLNPIFSISSAAEGEVNNCKNKPLDKAFTKLEVLIKKLVDKRKKDFEFIFLMKNPDSYIFTYEFNHNQMLSRETITRDVNRVMSFVSKSLPDQPNITSHSFRVGYISKLWKNSKDIEFVKQSVGHRRLDTTSSYVK
jgi:hypothetical protein